MMPPWVMGDLSDATLGDGTFSPPGKNSQSFLIFLDSLASSTVGTPWYWPPERFDNNIAHYDIRADVWSLGITLLLG